LIQLRGTVVIFSESGPSEQSTLNFFQKFYSIPFSRNDFQSLKNANSGTLSNHSHDFESEVITFFRKKFQMSFSQLFARRVFLGEPASPGMPKS